MKNVSKEALTNWTSKVLKEAGTKIGTTLKETGQIGAAQIGSEYAKNIIDNI